MEFLAFIFSVIVFCIFVGMFLRLGRIEIILKKMATRQGAIENGTPKQARASKGKFDLDVD